MSLILSSSSGVIFYPPRKSHADSEQRLQYLTQIQQIYPIRLSNGWRDRRHNVGDVDLWLAPHRGSKATGVVYLAHQHHSSVRLIITCLAVIKALSLTYIQYKAAIATRPLYENIFNIKIPTILL